MPQKAVFIFPFKFRMKVSSFPRFSLFIFEKHNIISCLLQIFFSELYVSDVNNRVPVNNQVLEVVEIQQEDRNAVVHAEGGSQTHRPVPHDVHVYIHWLHSDGLCDVQHVLTRLRFFHYGNGNFILCNVK